MVCGLEAVGIYGLGGGFKKCVGLGLVCGLRVWFWELGFGLEVALVETRAFCKYLVWVVLQGPPTPPSF